jgi:hypothetical protein
MATAVCERALRLPPSKFSGFAESWAPPDSRLKKRRSDPVFRLSWCAREFLQILAAVGISQSAIRDPYSCPSVLDLPERAWQFPGL